jgi:hypothetical protein
MQINYFIKLNNQAGKLKEKREKASRTVVESQLQSHHTINQRLKNMQIWNMECESEKTWKT